MLEIPEKSEELETEFELVTKGILLPLVCIVGILGNSICTIVLSHKEMFSVVNSLLLGYTVADTVFLTGNLITMVQPYSKAVTVAGETGFVLVVMLITVKQLQSACHGFKFRPGRNFLTGITSLVILMVSIVSGIPYVLEIESLPVIVEDEVELLQAEGDAMNETTVISYEQWRIMYLQWGRPVFLVLIPATVTCLLSIVLAIKVRQSYRVRQDLSGFQRCEISLTKILLCVVAWSVICSCPKILLEGVTYTGYGDRLGVDWIQALGHLRSVSELLLSIRAASNFWVFYIMGNRFRATLFQRLVDLKNCGRENRKSTTPGKNLNETSFTTGIT